MAYTKASALRRRRFLDIDKSGVVGLFDELTLRVMNWLRHELQAYACMNGIAPTYARRAIHEPKVQFMTIGQFMRQKAQFIAERSRAP